MRRWGGGSRIRGCMAKFAQGLVGFFGVLTGCMVIPTHGDPAGPSMRIGDEVATLIATAEPYRHFVFGGKPTNRYTVELYLYPSGRKETVGRGVGIGALGQTARLLGADGDLLWFYVDGLGAWDARRGRKISSEDLRRANPTLKDLPGIDNSNNPLIAPEARKPISTNDDLWDGDPRRMSFAGHLRVRTPDWKRVLEIDPVTLQAREAGSSVATVAAVSPVRTGVSAKGMVTVEKPGAWQVETGITKASLTQTIAGDGFTALRGMGRSKDGVIAEPLLVIVRHEKGEVKTTTLWQ